MSFVTFSSCNVLRVVTPLRLITRCETLRLASHNLHSRLFMSLELIHYIYFREATRSIPWTTFRSGWPGFDWQPGPSRPFLSARQKKLPRSTEPAGFVFCPGRAESRPTGQPDLDVCVTMVHLIDILTLRYACAYFDRFLGLCTRVAGK